MNKESDISDLIESIKDKKRDYVGVNGCFYQDLERQELDTIINYIYELEQINKQLKENYSSIDKGMTCLMEQRDLCKSVIDEIRKKIDEFDLGKYDYSIPIFVLQEILDKIKE